MLDDIATTAVEGAAGSKKNGNKLHDWGSTIAIIILAPLIALLLTNFVFQSYQVDGPSMETTLQDKDRLIVSKTAKTWSRVTNKDYLPKRYSIIIFNLIEGQDGEKRQLVKRVIGLPGDRVVVKDGVVRVYNNEHPQGYLIDQEGPEKDVISSTSGPGEREIDETVKDGYVYVMGDNRGNSLDSRSFGAVPSKDIVGRLDYRIFPFDKFEKF